MVSKKSRPGGLRKHTVRSQYSFTVMLVDARRVLRRQAPVPLDLTGPTQAGSCLWDVRAIKSAPMAAISPR